MTAFAIFISLWPQICLDDKIKAERRYVNTFNFKPVTDIWGDAGAAIKFDNTCEHKRGKFCGRSLCHASCEILCAALAPSLPMEGQFFREESHYSSMALRLSKDYVANPE